jgi:hypothetical protein
LEKETREQALAHAKYEYDMARFCIGEMNQRQTQAHWNVLLAAFAVYFRNCRDFLKNEGDQNAIKARHYVDRKNFTPASAGHLEKELQKLHDEIVHLSSKRTSTNEQKLGLEGANKLMGWLRANVTDFVEKLSHDDRARWDDNFGYRGTPHEIATSYTGPPQSTNHAIFEQTTNSSPLGPMDIIDLSPNV